MEWKTEWKTEWTQEKIEKVQEELQKTYKERSTHGIEPIWHEFLETFGIRVGAKCCGEGELLFLDPAGDLYFYPLYPYGHNGFLVIPKDTAERILVLGL